LVSLLFISLSFFCSSSSYYYYYYYYYHYYFYYYYRWVNGSMRYPPTVMRGLLSFNCAVYYKASLILLPTSMGHNNTSPSIP